MANLYRTRIALTGWEGAPGVNTVYWTAGLGGSGVASPQDVADFHQELGNAWQTMGGYCCDSYTATVQGTVDVLDPATGDITGIVQSNTAEPVFTQGTATISKLSRATMVCVALQTDVWRNGRRLAGRYFIGPLNTEAFGEDGQILASASESIQDSLYASITGLGPRLAVYHRPTAGQANGYYGDVVNVVARRKPAVLTSRRD